MAVQIPSKNQTQDSLKKRVKVSWQGTGQAEGKDLQEFLKENPGAKVSIRKIPKSQK
jgi:hypothetical protein